MAEDNFFIFLSKLDNHDFKNFPKKIPTLFDPLGLLESFITTLKILMPEAWSSEFDWHDTIPDMIKKNMRNVVSRVVEAEPYPSRKI